ncbi:unnamed protein product, partial [Mycena citricolor]
PGHGYQRMFGAISGTGTRPEGISLAPPLLGMGVLPPIPQPILFPCLRRSDSGGLHPPRGLVYPYSPSPTTPSTASDLPGNRARPSRHRPRPPPDHRLRLKRPTPRARGLAGSSRAPHRFVDPILAKVEFDIDRRRAAWYDPWLRSRRLNRAKRKNSDVREDESSVEEHGRMLKPPLELRLNGREKNGSPGSLPPDPVQYFPLSESPSPMEDEDALETGKDPLADVFGSDADTWAEVHAENAEYFERPTNPHIVQLALSAGELGEDNADGGEDDLDDDSEPQEDLKEIVRLLGRSELADDVTGISSSTSKKRAPPPSPLNLSTPSTPNEMHEPAEKEPVMLPYLDEAPEDQSDADMPRKSLYDPDKRGGGFYDDMDFGFDTSDVEFDDPNDRRKSQVILHAQLDEIERNLAQFSPRKLKSELEDEQSLSLARIASQPTLSPQLNNSDVLPPTPRLASYSDIHPADEDSSDTEDLTRQAWPAVPFNALPDRAPSQASTAPRLALNGVSTSMPSRFRANSRAGPSPSPSESDMRKQEHAEAYPAFTPAIEAKTSLNSPLLPLSPDPFGRHPSSNDTRRMSQSYWDAPAPAEAPKVERKRSTSTTSGSLSRFSTESLRGLAERQSNRGTIMSVKGIKSLWRKSHKNSPSVSVISPVLENAFSPLSPPLPPQRPNRPSMEEMQFPDVEVEVPIPKTPIMGSFPSSPPPVPPSPRLSPRPPPQEMPMPPTQFRPGQYMVPPPMLQSTNRAPIIAAKAGPMSRKTSSDNLEWDQESPYPTRKASLTSSVATSSRSHTQTPPPSSSPPNPTPAPLPSERDRNATRKSILKWKAAANFQPDADGERHGVAAPVVPRVTQRGFDIPPSPKIPDQFVPPATQQQQSPPRTRPNSAAIARRRVSAKMQSVSTTETSSSWRHRTQESMTFSSSDDTHESATILDTSAFEIVSPKMGATLSFPYANVDSGAV